MKGHEGEKELFLIGKELTYKMVTNIIKSNIETYDNINNHDEINKLKLENENLKLSIELNKNPNQHQNINVNELLKLNKLMFEKIESIETLNKHLLEKLNNIQVKNESTTNFGETNKNFEDRVQKLILKQKN